MKKGKYLISNFYIAYMLKWYFGYIGFDKIHNILPVSSYFFRCGILMCHFYGPHYVSVGQHCSGVIQRKTGLAVKTEETWCLGLCIRSHLDRERSDQSRNLGRVRQQMLTLGADGSRGVSWPAVERQQRGQSGRRPRLWPKPKGSTLSKWVQNRKSRRSCGRRLGC